MIYDPQPDVLLVKPVSPPKEKTIFDVILGDILEEGDYEVALLSDSDGFAIAAAPFDRMTDMTAAMTALLRDTANQAHHHLKLSNINELSMVTDNRLRFVCRFFYTDAGQSLTLTVMALADQPYRRITNHAVTRLKEACDLSYSRK